MTAPVVPARSPQLPGEQMILLFVNRTPATSIATYGSPFGSPALSLSSRRSTTMPFAPAVNSSMTPAPGAAKIPAPGAAHVSVTFGVVTATRSEEHTSELQSRLHLVCRLLLEKKKKKATE